MSLHAAGASDVGKKREHNEDCFFMNLPMGMFMVADGMGGHAAGEVASKIATETVDQFVREAGDGFQSSASHRF